MKGKISVILPTLNRPTLKEALESVFKQSYSDFEIILVDTTGELKARSVFEEFKNEKLRYFSSSRLLNSAEGRNFGIKKATGDFFVFFDDDDVLPPDSFEVRLKFLVKQPKEVGMIFARYRKFIVEKGKMKWLKIRNDKKRKFIDFLKKHNFAPKLTFETLKKYNFVYGGTPIVKKEVLDKIGGFDEKFECFVDYDFWLKVAKNYRLNFLDRIVYFYRRPNPEAITNDVFKTSLQTVMKRTGKSRHYALLLCKKWGIKEGEQFKFEK